MPPGIEAFPPWVQVIFSIGVFIAAAWVWLKGFFKGVPAPSRDVVVPSLTVADSQEISRWSRTLREANEIARDREEHDREVLFELRAMNRHLEEMKHATFRIRDKKGA